MKKRTVIIGASLLALHLLSLVTATRELHHYSHKGKQTQAAVVPKSLKNMTGEESAAADTMKIGSSPPRCEYKCSGCTPCEPTEVPATSSAHGFMHIQYTNYKPEGWKCKCGPSFYNP